MVFPAPERGALHSPNPGAEAGAAARRTRILFSSRETRLIAAFALAQARPHAGPDNAGEIEDDDGQIDGADVGHVVVGCYSPIPISAMVGPSVASRMFSRNSRAVTAGNFLWNRPPIFVPVKIVFQSSPSRY